mmetsp:Transcript_16660/g.14571  ORF Transcript_16660/g.14571 Transcript_16660/m.14571 type:complete len:214 (+) Transcript_16660:18-659(+)
MKYIAIFCIILALTYGIHIGLDSPTFGASGHVKVFQGDQYRISVDMDISSHSSSQEDGTESAEILCMNVEDDFSVPITSTAFVFQVVYDLNDIQKGDKIKIIKNTFKSSVVQPAFGRQAWQGGSTDFSSNLISSTMSSNSYSYSATYMLNPEDFSSTHIPLNNESIYLKCYSIYFTTDQSSKATPNDFEFLVSLEDDQFKTEHNIHIGDRFSR